MGKIQTPLTVDNTQDERLKFFKCLQSGVCRGNYHSSLPHSFCPPLPDGAGGGGSAGVGVVVSGVYCDAPEEVAGAGSG